MRGNGPTGNLDWCINPAPYATRTTFSTNSESLPHRLREKFTYINHIYTIARWSERFGLINQHACRMAKLLCKIRHFRFCVRLTLSPKSSLNYSIILLKYCFRRSHLIGHTRVNKKDDCLQSDRGHVCHDVTENRESQMSGDYSTLNLLTLF